jgi:hypothetical protein
LESGTCHDATIATVFSRVVIIDENAFFPYIGRTGRNVASVEREGVILPRSRKNTSWQIVASWQVFDLAGFILPRLFFLPAWRRALRRVEPVSGPRCEMIVTPFGASGQQESLGPRCAVSGQTRRNPFVRKPQRMPKPEVRRAPPPALAD